MVTNAALCRPEREMMLNPVALEDFGAAIVPMNGDGDGDRTLGIFQAVAVIRRDLQVIGHQVELLAGHAKRGMVINVHGRDASEKSSRVEGLKRCAPPLRPRFLVGHRGDALISRGTSTAPFRTSPHPTQARADIATLVGLLIRQSGNFALPRGANAQPKSSRHRSARV